MLVFLVGGFSPPHLKNMPKSNWIMKPQAEKGVKTKIFETTQLCTCGVGMIIRQQISKFLLCHVNCMFSFLVDSPNETLNYSMILRRQKTTSKQELQKKTSTVPGDSKCSFYCLFGGHLVFERFTSPSPVTQNCQVFF